MIEFGQAPVGGLDLIFRGIPGDAEDFMGLTQRR